MNSKKAARLFAISSLILIIAVLSFTGGLNIASFQKNYTKSLISSYAVSGGETVRKIEYAVKYGKPLENFFAIEELLQAKIADSSDLKEVQIVLNDGSIIYNHTGALSNVNLSPGQLENVAFRGEFLNSSYTFDIYDGDYHVYLPIKDRDKQWIGSLSLIFSEDIIKNKTNDYFRQLVTYLGLIAAVVLITFIIFFSKVSILTNTSNINKKALLTFLLIVLGIVQITFGTLNYYMFKNAYVDIAKENTSFASTVISNDIDSVISKGVSYDQLFKIEDYLNSIVKTVPEIETIQIINDKSELLYTSSNQSTESRSNDLDAFSYDVNLLKDRDGRSAKISVTLSQAYIDKQLKTIILDTVTVIVTSFLLTVELALFLVIFLRRQVAKQNDKDIEIDNEVNEDRTIVRTLAFIVFFSIFLTTSFITIVMKKLYVPIAGIPKEVVIGLPLTAEMLCAGIFTVVAGYLIDKKGWKPVFYLGLIILAIGTLLSGLSSNGIMFILARAVTGTGYGMALMAMRGFVNGTSVETKRTEGFTAHVSGLFAGINCGVIVGAMLADRIGYSQVFFVALFIMLIVAIFASIFMKNSLPDEGITKDDVVRTYKPVTIRTFFTNSKVILFFILILMPTASISMFLDYYFPIFAESVGGSSSDVGRAFLINGLAVVYLGPILSKYCLKYLGIKKSILLAGAISAFALVSFSITGTLIAGFLTALLLGVAESFGMTAQNNYFANLQAAKEIGAGKAFGFYGNIKKLGQMSGPMIFGTSAIFGILGVGFIGMILIIFVVLFVITSQKQSRLHVQHGTGVDM